MGFLGKRDVNSCWDSIVGIPVIIEHMSLNRFQQLRRYFHVYGPSNDIDDINPNRPWYYKFEPLCSILRPLFRQYLHPVTYCAIDKCIAQFTGRTKHTTYIERKPITDGYKIIALAFAGYIWDFVWWSGDSTNQNKVNTPGPSQYNNLWKDTYGFTARSQQAVLTLCMSLSYFEITFGIFMDNYYTSIKLFSFMRTMFGIGAMGTLRFGKNLNSDFSRQIQQLKNDVPTSQGDWTYWIVDQQGTRRRNPVPRPPRTAKELC